MNLVKDKNGIPIVEGNYVKYFDSYKTWLASKIIDIGACLAVETPDNPIPLHDFFKDEVYDGTPIKELEIITETEYNRLNN